jgi:hypothetical protein
MVLRYAYILTHPGIPTVFYPHLFGDGSADDSGPTSGKLAPKIRVNYTAFRVN